MNAAQFLEKYGDLATRWTAATLRNIKKNSSPSRKWEREGIQKLAEQPGAEGLLKVEGFDDFFRAEIQPDGERFLELIAEGVFGECEYCKKYRLPADVSQQRIYRNRGWQFHPYCKDNGCAGWAQMASEG